jgi:hypothetical protein
VIFSDALRHEIVLAGRGAARRSQRAADGRLSHDELALEPGARLALDLARQALVVHRVETRLVKADAVDFVINGTVVHTAPKAGLPGTADGIAGIRVNHQLNVQITGFAITR